MGKIKKIIKFTFKLIFKIYSIIAITIFSFFVIWIPYVYITHFYECAELPNKTRLCPKSFLNNEIVLKNEKGDIIINSRVMHVAFDEEYIYGDRIIKKNNDNKFNYFIYKKGWDKAEEFDLQGSFSARKWQLNLHDFIEIAPNSYKSIEKTYWDLIKDLKYHREWYE